MDTASRGAQATATPRGAAPAPARTGTALCAAALLAAIAIACHGSFRGAFHFDDMELLVENPDVRSLWPPAYLTKSLRPFAFASFALSYALSGYDVWAWHAMNLAVHAGAALLLFGVARRALTLPRVAFGDTGATATAFAMALLWSVHPLNTQAVVYVIQRAECMAALAYLGCLYALLRGAGAATPLVRRSWLAASAGAFYAGLGCKETIVTAPVAAYLLDALLISGSFTEPMRRRGALYAALALPFVALPLLWLAVAPQRFSWLVAEPGTLAPLDYAAAQAAVILRYLALVVYPAPLIFDHAWDPAAHAHEVPWAAAALVAVGLGIAEAARRGARLAWVGAAFFLLLAPSSSLQPLADLMVEHRMYLASAAPIALVVLGARALLLRALPGERARRLAGAAALAAATAALSGLTVARLDVYASPLLLWQDVVAKAPHNARAHFNLGLSYLARGAAGDADRALAHFERAGDLQPGHVKAQNNAAAILMARGRASEAEVRYRAAAGALEHPELLRSHANALLALGHAEEAVEALLRARRLLRDEDVGTRAEVLNDLAAARARTGRIAQAIEDLREAAALEPRLVRIRVNLARLLAAERRTSQAIDAYLAALALDPAHEAASVELLAVCVRDGAAARAHLAEVLRRDPANAAAARVLRDVGR